MKNAFKTAVLKDKRYKRFKEMIEQGSFALDTQKLVEELETLHSTRKMRRVKAPAFLKNAQQHIIELTLENTAYRSRSVEIMMQVFRLMQNINEHIKNMSIYLQSQYNAELKEFGTVEARRNAVSNMMFTFTKVEGQFRLVFELAQFVVKDIDQAGYGIKAINDAMMLGVKGNH